MRRLAILAAAMLAGPATAGSPEVLEVRASPGSGGWRFDVTVRHDDSGWDHYADGWSVLAPDGTVLGQRKLLHPHETEQPFTRSLTGVVVPEGLSEVHVRAQDSVHGPGEVFVYRLPGR